MNNFEIIKQVEQIVSPYFNFNMDDFYGDRGSCIYPKIEELKTLFFKLNGKDRKLFITIDDQQKMVDKIKNLNIGLVEICKTPFGLFIIIHLSENLNFNDFLLK